MASELQHAILGAGGIGGLIGASLAHSGAPVTMVVRPESLRAHPHQLRLESLFGNITASVSIAADVPPCDVLWLTVKATQLEPALRAITNPSSVRTIVPLLNGIDHIASLRQKYGQEKIVPGTIAVESERVAPGHIIHRSPFARLNVHSSGQALLAQTLERLQKLGFECKFIPDEPTLMWGKLVFLAPFALTSTASDQTTGVILSDPKWRQLGLGCIRETCAVGVAEGAKLNADMVIAGVLKMPGNMRSSMQKDVEQGRPPELDAIAGPIVKGAQRHGIPIPATQELVAAVERRANVVLSR